ncbi:hypothetical protein ACJX0J_019663 [Zea mays]
MRMILHAVPILYSLFTLNILFIKIFNINTLNESTVMKRYCKKKPDGLILIFPGHILCPYQLQEVPFVREAAHTCLHVKILGSLAKTAKNIFQGIRVFYAFSHPNENVTTHWYLHAFFLSLHINYHITKCARKIDKETI